MEKVIRFVTSEAVSPGHPDKVADQISDAILDLYLKQDPDARVACETLVTENRIIVAGEITSVALITAKDREKAAREVVQILGYDNFGFDSKTVEYQDYIHEQSPDIHQCVIKDIVAGDQGIMFGYSTNESPDGLPLQLSIARTIINTLYARKYKIFGPDAKCLVTLAEHENIKPSVVNILVSVQHIESATNQEIRQAVQETVESVLKSYELYLSDFQSYTLNVNPSGRFVKGGPAADTGLTGRKIIVDTYGGVCPHGGGAFSGKDPSKVDRSAAYFARYVANHLVHAGVCDKCIISLAYAIGESIPIIFEVNTLGTNKTNISDRDLHETLVTCFDPKTSSYIPKYKTPIYRYTAMLGHFGTSLSTPWEMIDYQIIQNIKSCLNLN